MKILDQQDGKDWTMYHGDCVEAVSGIPSNSVDYTIFSPPFASLYTYSASDRDMGNCATDQEFADHFRFLVRDLMRVTKPGRLLSFHCMNLPASKVRDGFIGLKDFRGDLIRMFVDEGWIFHSEVTIWKDPVQAMVRTNAIGLLYKQLRKDSAMSRQGIPDYLVTVRKPGVNPDPVTKDSDEFPVERWQRYASPVWATLGPPDPEGFLRVVGDDDGSDSGTVSPSDTLQYRSARANEDERHICPLQLPVIRRAIRLWTNPGDIVLSPFGGIGSEGYVALEEGRKFIGVELKPSYWGQACRNLSRVGRQQSLF